MGSWTPPPLAPVALHFDDGSAIALYALVSVDEGRNATFRTRDVVLDKVVGAMADLQQWWTPEAHAAASVVRRDWVHELPTADHEHCLLDWTKIGSRAGAAAGWHSGGDWICDDCYSEYILRDRCELRG